MVRLHRGVAEPASSEPEHLARSYHEAVVRRVQRLEGGNVRRLRLGEDDVRREAVGFGFRDEGEARQLVDLGEWPKDDIGEEAQCLFEVGLQRAAPLHPGQLPDRRGEPR